MFRDRRFAKSVLALSAAAVLALAISGCAFVKPGSLAVSQPGGIGSVRVHFVICTVGGAEFCGPNETEAGTLQYLVGIAVPPGSVPPATFTAVPIKGGAPIVFTRNEEVAAELTASSAAQQKVIGEAKTPEEAEEAKEFNALIGGLWPPSGLQGVGYLSAPVAEAKGDDGEWSVEADFGLPIAADGSPFGGPFATGIAMGFREVSAGQPASRPVRCLKIEAGPEPQESEAFCGGSVQQSQLGTSDLRIAGPAKLAQAFVGGSAKLAFPLQFAGSAATVPTFALSATTTAKGGKAKLAPASFTPGAPDPSTHQSATGTGMVEVSVPRGIKTGTYLVTLTATTAQGATATQVGKLKVTKPRLKLRGLRRNTAKGIATLRVKLPSGGRLTISGKGVTRVVRRVKKQKTVAVKIAPKGRANALLDRTGRVKVKVKATFKPTSGISVSKTKPTVLVRR